MSRTARLFDLMQVLRRHRRPVNGAALAEELGISVRTLYRDIAVLKSIGADIEGEPGLGYMLKPGFMLPPLMFSEVEAEALALGLKWVERRGDDELAAAAGDVLAKVASVLPSELRNRLDDPALVIGRGWSMPQSIDLKVLRRAIREESKLAIHYRDRQGEASVRNIWPFSLGFFESTRVLAAWCELRGDFRHFRVDRIEAATPLDEHYPRRRHALHKTWLEILKQDRGEQPLTATSAPLDTPDRPKTLPATPATKKRLLTQSVSTTEYPCPAFTHNREKTMTQEIVFYTNPHSRGGIVHWLLEELAVPYRVEHLEYGTSMKSPEYLAVNPMGKVPAIRHGEVVVTESAAICAYLADAFPEAGLAPELHERGPYYRWLFFVAGPLEQAIGLRGCKIALSAEQEKQLGCGNTKAVSDTLAAAVKDRRYIAGDRFTAADVYVGSHIGWGMQFGTIDRRPEFEDYWADLKERPAHRRSQQLSESMAAKQAWGSE